MKVFNAVVTNKKIDSIKSAGSLVRLLQSLGYSPVRTTVRDCFQNAGVTTVYQTSSDDRFQCILLELKTMDEPALHGIFRQIVRNKPWNLVATAVDYRFLYVFAVSATCIPGITSEPDIFPSVKVRRINLYQPSESDCRFFEELTMTCTNDQQMFDKIRYAFNRCDICPDSGIPMETGSDSDAGILTEQRHLLRTTIQPFRNMAFGGSWHERAVHLIHPVLQNAGYSIVPGGRKNSSGSCEPDVFLYTGNPETPGATPVAACLYADPLENPFCSQDQSDTNNRIRFPEYHVRCLLRNPLIRKVIVTDGRIWRVCYETTDRMNRHDMDLFRILDLDRTRLLTSLQEYRCFLESVGPEMPDPCSSTDIPGAAFYSLLKNTDELIQTVIPSGADSVVIAEKFLFQMFYMFYCDTYDRVPQTDRYRQNIPQLIQLADARSSFNPNDVVNGYTAYLKAFRCLDQTRNSGASLFSSPLYPIIPTSGNADSAFVCDTEKLVRLLPEEKVCSVLNQAAEIWLNDFEAALISSADTAGTFCMLLHRYLFPDSDSTLSSEDSEKVLQLLETRRNAVDQRLNTTETVENMYYARCVTELLFRIRVVDTHPNPGYRLIQVLHYMEQVWQECITGTANDLFTEFFRTFRHILIKDSDTRSIFLDHGCLTYSGLLRYMIIQHCLYGLTRLDSVVGSALFLQTGLVGIRFPYTGHHFAARVEGTPGRLRKGYAGRLPDSVIHSSSALSGTVAAARWISDQERDMEAFGPDFMFTQRRHAQTAQAIRDGLKRDNPDDVLPAEWVFPWVFYSRLSGDAPSDNSGHGFDLVLD